jgi:membrane protein DedA with SNARE-associated domain
MRFIRAIEEFLKDISTRVPVELFTCLGAFVEEVIAPIPSPLVMATAGSIAFSQGKGTALLLWLSLVGAAGKVAGAWLVYWVAAELEEVFVNRFGRFFGVSHRDVENLAGHFKGGLRDGIILTVLRAAPIMPSAPVSVICGLIRMRRRAYLTATFLGTVVRNLVYLYIGYAGLAVSEKLIAGFTGWESVLQAVSVAIVAAFVGWVYWKRRGGTILDWLKHRLGK